MVTINFKKKSALSIRDIVNSQGVYQFVDPEHCEDPVRIIVLEVANQNQHFLVLHWNGVNLTILDEDLQHNYDTPAFSFKRVDESVFIGDK